MPPKKKGAYKMGTVVTEGTLLVDTNKKAYRLGKAFAQGGFGRIYTARMAEEEEGGEEKTKKKKKMEETLVVKMEPAENGPLFQETHTYQRLAKKEMILAWMKENKVAFLGIAPYISSGVLDVPPDKHRFLILPRYRGGDLEALRTAAPDARLSPDIVFGVGRTCADALRYLHDHNYVHADLKAGNLLLADQRHPTQVVLVDFGLAKRVPDPPVYKQDKKRAHDGTALFASLDAHRGYAPSYRGDFEILAYNLLYWLLGSLPWSKDADDPEKILQKKQQFSQSVESTLGKLLKTPFAKDLMALFDYVYLLDYVERPDYTYINKLLDSAVKPKKTSSKSAKQPAVASSSSSSSTRSEATTSSSTSRKSSPLKVKPTTSRAAKRLSSSPESPASSRRTSMKRANVQDVAEDSPEVLSRTPSPVTNRPITAARRLLKQTPLSLARPPIRNGVDVHCDVPGVANMAAGRSKKEKSAVESPRATVTAMIPGAANMQGVRRSIGATLVRKYIQKDLKKSRTRAPVVNGSAQTSPNMW